MRTRRFVTFRLCAALLCISALVSCKPKPRVANYSFKSDRLVTIQMSPAPNVGCEVDFPVAFMRTANNNKIAWASDDNAYTVQFVSYLGGPSPASPFNSTTGIAVPAGHKSAPQTLSGSPGYYRYQILDANNNVCKTSDDDHDTGLNIKR